MSKIIKVFFVWSLIFIAVFFVWKTSMARLLASKDPQLSLEYSSGYSKALLASNKKILQQSVDLNEASSKIIFLQAQRALKKSPINDTPFLQVALSESFLKGTFVRQDLFLATKRRNLRNGQALRSLLSLDAAKGDIAAVMENLDILTLFGGENVAFTQQVFSQISAAEQGRQSIVSYLKDRPIWGNQFIKHQISEMNVLNIENVSTFLVNFSDPAHQFSADQKLHEQYLKKLVQLGAFSQAYTHWKNTLPKKTNHIGTLVYDESFNNQLGFTPFNWQLFRGLDYFAEMVNGGGVHASINRGSARTTISQTVQLVPGNHYQLIVNAKWQYKQRQGYFIWRVRCLPTKKVILELPLDDDHRELSEASADFVVPVNNCKAQDVQLFGRPGQYNSRIGVMIKSVNITALAAE